MPKRKSNDGLYLRGTTWWLDFQHEGKRFQFRLGRGISKTVAKELAKAKRGEVLKGEAGLSRKKRDLPFDQARELFVQWAQTNKRPRTAVFYDVCLRQLAAQFGNRRLSQIHPFHVEAYKSMRVKDGAPVRANRELATLKAMYNRLTKLKRYEGVNPAVGIQFLEESKGKLRILDDDEEDRLLEACGEPLRTIALTAIYTGLRVTSELLELRWGAVDFYQNHVMVQAAYAKNRESRSIPMNSLVSGALLSHKQAATNADSEDAHVFLAWKGPRGGKPLRSIRSALETACRKAKLSGVTPHTLRHTFASRLVMAGVDLRTVQELGGWKDLKMVERYAHLSREHKAGQSARQSEKKSLRYSLHSRKQIP